MTKAEEVLQLNNRHDALNLLALQFTRYLEEMGYFQTCLNCHHWNSKNELCKLANMRPPAKVIVCGCIEHMDVPF